MNFTSNIYFGIASKKTVLSERKAMTKTRTTCEEMMNLVHC